MVEEKVILQVLAEQKDEVEKYKHKQWISRKEEQLFEFESNLAQVVIGVRRSGKSTLCHKVLKERKIKYAYANLDDDRMASMQAEDLNTLLSCIYQTYGTDVKYIFFDEIQNVDGWHLLVNRLLRTDVHVFVTGSNAKLLSGELSTYLTGRYNEIHLYPFSFSEYCTYNKIDKTSITTKAESERKQALAEYLNEGGFPEIQSLRNKRGYVQSLLDAVLNKDIQQRFNIRNVDALRKIAYMLISNACQTVNYEEMSTVLDMTGKTIKKYVDYLQQAFIVQLLPKFSYKSRDRIVGEKSYVVDTGIENNINYSMAGENIGWRLENVVYIELMRRCSKYFQDIYYYKPSSRAKEVDFVVCSQNKPVELIQVAFDIEKKKAFDRETSALLKASEDLHCNNLTLIAFSPSRKIEIDGKEIHIYSAIDWLLQ
jgi:hypothetical protein